MPLFLTSCTSKPPYTITIGDTDPFRQKKSDKPRKPYSWSTNVIRTAKVKLKKTGIEFICQSCEFGQAYILKPGETINSALADINRNPHRIEFPAKLYTSKLIGKSGNIINVNAKSIFLKFNPSTKVRDIEKIQSFVADRCPNDICKIGNSWTARYGVNKDNMHYVEKVASKKLTIKTPYGEEQLLITLNEVNSIDLFGGNLVYRRVMTVKDIKMAEQLRELGQTLINKGDLIKDAFKNLNNKSGKETIPINQLKRLMNEGKGLLSRREFDAALEKFQEHLNTTKEFNARNIGVTLNETEVWSNIMIARTYNKMERYDLTIKQMTPFYKKVKAKATGYLVSLNALRKPLGDAHFASDNYVIARQLYEEAYTTSISLTDKKFNKKNPQFGFASRYRKQLLENIGRSLEKLKKNADAARYFLNARKEIWSSLIPRLTNVSRDKKTYLLETTTSGDSLVYPFVFANNGVPAVYGFDESLLSNKLHFESNRLDKYRLPPVLNKDLIVLFNNQLSARQEISRLSVLLKNNKQAISKPEKKRIDARIHTVVGKLRNIENSIDKKTESRKQHAILQHVTYDDVLLGLREDEVIIQYVKYKQYDSNQGKSNGNSQYGVMVARGGSKDILAFNIGPATIVDDKIEDYRKSILESAQKKDEAGLRIKGNNLRDLLLSDIIKSNILKDTRRIYLVPDSQISLLSFESLPSQAGNRYLVQEFEIVYLMTARDIPFYRQQANLNNPDLIWFIGDPDFSNETAPSGSNYFKTILNKPVRLLKKYSENPVIPFNWDRLDRTNQGISRMSELLNSKKLPFVKLTGPNATESNVLKINSTESLIFTTHGYFDSSKQFSSLAISLFFPKTDDGIGLTASAETNPLHDSMLILSGANSRNHQLLDDGLLTAYEVWGMDLRNTDFVALIGCETGLSTRFNKKGLGNSLGGLREAFFVAGARSILMSLWEVPVNATMTQFEDFFGKYQEKTTSRYLAFRKAQLSALERARIDKGTTHPIWWGGFVYIGDPGDLP